MPPPVPTMTPFPMYGFTAAAGHRPVPPPQPPAATTLFGLDLDGSNRSALETMTAAITNDPNFTTVVAAALSTIMAGGAEPPVPRSGAADAGDGSNGSVGIEPATAAAAGARENALHALLQRLHDSRQ